MSRRSGAGAAPAAVPVRMSPDGAPLISMVFFAMSWGFLLWGAGLGMDTLSMSTFEFPPPVTMNTGSRPWAIPYAFMVLIMWWVMMIAMMLPGMARFLGWSSLFGDEEANIPNRRRQGSSFLFCMGYSMPWLLFSVAVTTVHFVLEQDGLLHGMMMWSLDRTLSAGILLCVGLYQFSPVKTRTAWGCKSLGMHTNSVRMGLAIGGYCLASSGPLMLLLFVGGVMNLVWIGSLTMINWLEKTVSDPRTISWPVGFLCLAGSVHVSGLLQI